MKNTHTIKKIICFIIILILTMTASLNAFADDVPGEDTDLDFFELSGDYLDSDTSSPDVDFTSSDTDSASSDTDSEISDTDTSPNQTDSEISDTDSTSPASGTYRIKQNDIGSVDIFELADSESKIIGKALSGTYHYIYDRENNFGYITYDGKSGWIKLESAEFITHRRSDEFTSSANAAVEQLLNYSYLTEINVTQYSELASALEAAHNSFITASDEQLSQSCTSLTYSSYILDAAVTFLENPNNPDLPENFRFYGDVNGDNKVSMIDVVYIQRYVAQLIAFSQVQCTAGDIDENGTVKVRDAVYVQYFLSEMMKAFPCGKLFHLN